MAEPRKPLDLRRPKPPPPPPPAARPAGPGPPPGFLAPGQVVDQSHLTPYERQQFAKLGVAPGTPVPGNLADLIQEIRNEAADPRLPLDPDFRLPPQQVFEVDQLDPGQQARVRAVIEQAAEQDRRLREIPQVPGAAPGVNEAIAAGTQGAPRVTVADDRHTRNQPAPPPPGTIPVGAVYVHQDRVADVPPEAVRSFAAPPPQAAPAPEPAPGTLTAAGAGDARFCPHCGWNQSLRDGIEATAADKYAFLWSVLGGPEKRFTKQFPLMGGKVVLNFRTLTSREADTTLLQIAHDYRRGAIAGDTNWFQRWMDYRLSFALESIAVEGAGKTYVGPGSLDEIEYDPPADENGAALPGTAYPALWEHVEQNHLYNESLRKAVSLAYASFVDLTKKLENNYDNPDFWQGIGEPA